MTKHAAIYPSEDELQSIQKIVSITERALRLVSDIITDQDKAKEEDKEKKEPSKDRCDSWAAYFFQIVWILKVKLECLVFLWIEIIVQHMSSFVYPSLPNTKTDLFPPKLKKTCSVMHS